MRFELGGLALVVAASLACGGSKPAQRGGPPAPSPDATTEVGPTDDAGGSAGDGGADALPPLPPTARALPAEIQPPVRLFGARAILADLDKTSCTHQTPPSGDGHRWCAFMLGPIVGGVAELWVIDVTRAATGFVPPCDGTDPGCVRLTDKVATRSVAFFEGDTLFYGTDSTAGPTGDFLGRIFAWRPGWSGGRQISSDAGITCIGNAHSAAAACLDDPAGNPANRDSANVRAGYLATENGAALRSFGRYPLRNDDNVAWAAKLSPDGSVFVLSDADTMGAKQTLRIAPTAAVGQAPPTIAIDDATRWQISNDGQKIYFMRGVQPDVDLYVADFPSGANVTLLETDAKEFWLIGDRPEEQAVEIRKSRMPGGTIELLADRSSTTPKVIFNYDDFLDGAVVSRDLRYTTWLNEDFRGVVFRNSDLSTCTIQAGPTNEVYTPSYLDDASVMFWTERSRSQPKSALRDAYFARPEACNDKTLLAVNIDQLMPVGDRGVIFTDELEVDTELATLKYIAAAGATLDPAGPLRVQEHVAWPVILVGQDPPLVVYKATGPTPETSGIFVFGPVPF
jgi:hypothetical protein